MGLECCLYGDGYVEVLDTERTTCGTIICRECGRLILPGEEYTVVRSWEYASELSPAEGSEATTAITEVCERCGGAIEAYLDAGYCYAPGGLKAMVAEMRAEHEPSGWRDILGWQVPT
jgi:hypothetical protein